MGNLNLGAGQLKADQWVNNDGTENFKCRAWVNFNGTGTVAIRASGNVLSITDNGVGDYTVNFNTAMPDANYNWTQGLLRNAALGDPAVGVANAFNNGLPTTTSLRIQTRDVAAGSTSIVDTLHVNIAVFR